MSSLADREGFVTLEIAFLQVSFKFQSSCTSRCGIIFISFAIILLLLLWRCQPLSKFLKEVLPIPHRALGDWNWEAAVVFQQLLAICFPLLHQTGDRHDSQPSVNTQLIWYASLQLFHFISGWNVLCYDLRKKKGEANHTQAVLSCLYINIKNLPSVSGSILWCSGLLYSPWKHHKSKKWSRLCRILLKCTTLSSKQTNQLF